MEISTHVVYAPVDALTSGVCVWVPIACRYCHFVRPKKKTATRNTRMFDNQTNKTMCRVKGSERFLNYVWKISGTISQNRRAVPTRSCLPGHTLNHPVEVVVVISVLQ